mgnify:CR=1 FL=1
MKILAIGEIIFDIFNGEAEIGGAEQEAKKIVSEAAVAAENKKREVLIEAKEEALKTAKEYTHVSGNIKTQATTAIETAKSKDSLNSSSVSPGKPTIISVVIVVSSKELRSFVQSSLYSALV